jgi:hypothetical protein
MQQELDIIFPRNTAANAYQWAEALFARARVPESGKPLCNHTRLFKRDENYAVRFHETDVVTITPDNEFVLNSGGWLTMSTKDRINSFCSANVFSHRGVWYVQPFSTDHRWDHHHAERFFDGIVVNAQGVVLNAMAPERAERLTARESKADDAVVKFVEGYIEALQRGMPAPSGGDCWYCAGIVQIASRERGDRGAFTTRPISEMSPSEEPTEHLWEHIRSGYHVPWMAVNALREKGYADVGVGMFLGIREDGTMGGPNWRDRRQVKAALLAYLRKRLVPGRAHR